MTIKRSKGRFGRDRRREDLPAPTTSFPAVKLLCKLLLDFGHEPQVASSSGDTARLVPVNRARVGCSWSVGIETTELEVSGTAPEVPACLRHPPATSHPWL